MKTFAWIAAIAVAIDALLAIFIELYVAMRDMSGDFSWELYEQLSSTSLAISLIASGILVAFFIHFSSRLKRGAAQTGALRLFVIAAVVLLGIDMVTTLVMMIEQMGGMNDGAEWKQVVYPSLFIVRGVLMVVLGVVGLLLANSSSGFTQVAGILTFIASLAGAAVLFAANGMRILDALGVYLPSDITGIMSGVLEYARWSIQIFWLLLAALLASIAAGIRNA